MNNVNFLYKLQLWHFTKTVPCFFCKKNEFWKVACRIQGWQSENIITEWFCVVCFFLANSFPRSNGLVKTIISHYSQHFNNLILYYAYVGYLVIHFCLSFEFLYNIFNNIPIYSAVLARFLPVGIRLNHILRPLGKTHRQKENSLPVVTCDCISRGQKII